MTTTKFGPRTKQRLIAYAVRVKSLPLLTETYGPSGNATVAAVRAQTQLNATDRAFRAKGGAGRLGPVHPNGRLATFGIKVKIDHDDVKIIGGTKRQQRCYLRAVERWLTSDALEDAAA